MLGLKEDEGKGEESHFCREKERSEGERDASLRLSATTPNYSLLWAATSRQASLTIPHPHPLSGLGDALGQPREHTYWRCGVGGWVLFLGVTVGQAPTGSPALL